MGLSTAPNPLGAARALGTSARAAATIAENETIVAFEFW
jgi:hypothetical protein